MAICMFSGSGNTERLVGILSDVWVCRKSKMAVINQKYIGNNVYIYVSQLVHMKAKKFRQVVMSWFESKAGQVNSQTEKR